MNKKSAPQKINPNPVIQIICESKKSDKKNIEIPKIKNKIAVTSELRFGCLGVIFIMVFRHVIFTIILV